MQLQFYTLPFDDTGFGYINDNKNYFAFMFLPVITKEQSNKIMASLNSKEYKPLVYKQTVMLEYIKSIKTINMNNKPFIIIRGWANLTSSNSFNFSAEKANEIQDNLAEWIISKLQ